MDIYSGHMNKLIEQLSRLPGVGAKSAQRLVILTTVLLTY